MAPGAGDSGGPWGVLRDTVTQSFLQQVGELAVALGTWPLCAARAARLRLMEDISLRAGPVTPDTPATGRDGRAVRVGPNLETGGHEPGKQTGPTRKRALKSRGSAQPGRPYTPDTLPGRPQEPLLRDHDPRVWTDQDNCVVMGVSRHSGDPVLGTRGLPAIRSAEPGEGPAGRGRPLTCALAARQVHELQPGQHPVRRPRARRRGPRTPRRGSAGSTLPPPCVRQWGRGAVGLREQ